MLYSVKLLCPNGGECARLDFEDKANALLAFGDPGNYFDSDDFRGTESVFVQGPGVDGFESFKYRRL